MTVYFGFAVADAMFTAPYCLVERTVLTLDEVRQAVADGVTPCFNPNHPATIDAMRQRFGISLPVPESAPTITLEPKDTLIVMSHRGLPRLEGRSEYTADEIDRAVFTFSRYRVLRSGNDSIDAGVQTNGE